MSARSGWRATTGSASAPSTAPASRGWRRARRSRRAPGVSADQLADHPAWDGSPTRWPAAPHAGADRRAAPDRDGRRRDGRQPYLFPRVRAAMLDAVLGGYVALPEVAMVDDLLVPRGARRQRRAAGRDRAGAAGAQARSDDIVYAVLTPSAYASGNNVGASCRRCRSEGVVDAVRILIVDDEPAMHDSYRRSFAPRRTEAPTRSTRWRPTCSATMTRRRRMRRRPDVHSTASCMQGLDAVAAVEAALAAGDAVRGRVHRRAHAARASTARRPRTRIRALDPDINLVIVTGYSDFSPLEISRAAGPADKIFYIAKPFEVAEIVQTATALGASLAGRPRAGRGARDARRAGRAARGAEARARRQREPRDPHGEPRFADRRAQPARLPARAGRARARGRRCSRWRWSISTGSSWSTTRSAISRATS